MYVPGVGALRALSCAKVEGQDLHFLQTRAGILQVTLFTLRQHSLHVIPLFKGRNFFPGQCHLLILIFSLGPFMLLASIFPVAAFFWMLFPMDSVATGASCVS